jgi:hypothetical protein
MRQRRSNIQGQRTVGHGHKPALVPLEKLAQQYGFEPPREQGYDTAEACGAIINGRVKSGVDREMQVAPPSGGRLKVIPPPGTPGGDQSVQPK